VHLLIGTSAQPLHPDGIAIPLLVFAVAAIVGIREHRKLKRRIKRITQEFDEL
jgi:hypothetical protein